MIRRTRLGRFLGALLALLLAVGTLSGCAVMAAGSQDDRKVVGLAVANLQADFFNQIRQSVQREANRRGIRLVIADAKGDPDTQVNQIQDFITRDVDAIIYIPAGATAATVPVRDARRAGIPVVTVDRNPDGAPGNTFIATDSEKAAENLGRWVAEQKQGQANIGVVQGQIGTTPEIARDTGFRRGIAPFPGVKIVASQASKQWAQDEGFNLATDMLQANPRINVFFGRADALALGAAQAVRAAGRKDVLVVGFDGDRAGLTAVQNGTLGATIVQQTQKMGRLAVDSALRLDAGETLPAEQLQPGLLATRDTVAPYIKEHP